METYPEEYNLTPEDIEKTERKIAALDLSREDVILSSIPSKLEILLSSKMDEFKADLINDVSKLYNVIMSFNGLDDDIRKKILYALDYFVDIDDEIPDEIPELGYLDDLVIVRYVVDQIMKQNSDLFQV